MAEAWWKGLTRLRARLGALMLWELGARLVAALVLWPVAAWMVYRLLQVCGWRAVANEDILLLLLSPEGCGISAVALTLGATISFLDLAGLLLVGTQPSGGAWSGVVRAAVIVATRARALLALAGWQIAAALILAVPFFIAAGAVYGALLSQFDINFYWTERPPAFWSALGLGLGLLGLYLAGLLVLFARWIAAVPLAVADRIAPLEALRLSWRRTRGRVLQVLVPVAGCLVAWSLVGAIVAAALQLVENVAIGWAGASVVRLVWITAALLAAYFVAALILSAATTAHLAMLVVEIVARLPGGDDWFRKIGQLAPDSEATRQPVSKRRVAMAFVAALLVSLVASGTALWAAANHPERPVAITAHRGSSKEAPENTLAAIRLAIEQGCQWAEIDVQETADGAVVVFHDADLMRIAGIKKNIWEVTLAELQEIDAGAWFDEKYRGERVPTLQQAIEVARGRIKLNIELKLNGHEKRLVERTVQIIRENRFQRECVVSCLKQEPLDEVQRLAPELEVGLIVAVSLGRPWELPYDFLSVATGEATPSLVRAAHRRGKYVHVWTVNDAATAHRVIDTGADNILTDDPPLVQGVLAERRQRTAAERLVLAFRRLVE